MWVQALGRKDPLEKEIQATPVFLPGESHGQKSLAGYSPRIAKQRLDLPRKSCFPLSSISSIISWNHLPFSEVSISGNFNISSPISWPFTFASVGIVCHILYQYFYQFFQFPWLFHCGYSEEPGGSDGKESACNAGDPSSIPESGRSPGEGNSYPLQHSCLEKSMDRGAEQATVHGVKKTRT